MKTYRVDYSNEKLGLEYEFDIITEKSDKAVLSKILNDDRYETIWDVVQLNDDYNEIKSIW